MKPSWNEAPIGSLGRVITGKTPPTKHTELFGQLYPFITPTDIDDGYRSASTTRFLSEEGRNSQRNALLPANSVCFTCIASIGKICMTVVPSFTNQQINSIVIDSQQHNPFFVYYLLRENAEKIRRQASGSATPILNKTDFSQIRLTIPPLSVQRKIATVLSAYDDLIENNTRRIQILEEMAHALYTEWFVHFRFPGHEQSKMKAATMGPIPEGWTATTVGVVSTFVGRGISPSYDETAEGLVINQKCIRDGRLNLALARKQSKPFSPDRLVRFGDVLINSTGIGTLGRVAQVYQDVGHCTVDSHVTIARPGSDVNVDYFGFQLLGMQAHFDSLGVGSTGQTELARERVAASPFLLPPLPRQDEFGEAVQDMRKIAILCERRNQNLRQTRDLLLPKLISGEVAVDDLDIQTGELT